MKFRGDVAFLCVFAPLVLAGAFVAREKRDNGHGFRSERSELATTKSLLDSFRLNCGRYPTTGEGLRALETCPKGLEKRWKGPYGSHLPVDEWGNSFDYVSSGPKQFELTSYGADGVPGGEGANEDVVVGE